MYLVIPVDQDDDKYLEIHVDQDDDDIIIICTGHVCITIFKT